MKVEIILFCIFLWFVIRKVREQSKVEEERKREIEATRRVEIIGGKKYSVVTVERVIVQQKKTGRLGILAGRGWEREPRIINGKMEMLPRWFHVQYINKKTNTASGKTFWTASQNWEFVSSEMVNEYKEL